MTSLHEHVGFAPGETVQIADRPGTAADFKSVVLEEAEYDALEPFLRQAEPTLNELWRYGETELSSSSAEHLAELLTEPGTAPLSDGQAGLFRLLAGWIRSRVAEGRTIYILGY